MRGEHVQSAAREGDTEALAVIDEFGRWVALGLSNLQTFVYVRIPQMWRLALADNHPDQFEEHMIRKISDLLYVDHGRFIEAKQRARASR